MKFLYPAVAAIIAAASFSSCKQTINCKKPITGKMYLVGSDTTGIITVVKYKPNTNFSVVDDSMVIDADAEKRYYYLFTENAEYKIFVSPQGREHTLTGLHFGHETKKGAPSMDTDMCAQSGSYTFDGKKVDIPYKDTYASVTYVYIGV